MDGDHSAKTFTSSATSALHTQDFSEAIPEAKPTSSTMAGAGTKETGQGTSVFSKDGAIGKHFTTDGAVGGTAQKLGEGTAFDMQGTIGKQFTAEGGGIGGKAQDVAEKNEEH